MLGDEGKLQSYKRFSDGMKLLQRGHINEAKGELRLALNYDPTNAHARLWLGLIYAKLEHYNKVEELWRDYSPIDERERLTLLSYLGLVYQHLKKFDDAIKIGSFLLERKPGGPFAHTFFGNLMIALNDYKKAKNHLQKAYNIRPGAIECNNYANILGAIGDIGEAHRIFQYALQKYPYHSLLRGNFLTLQKMSEFGIHFVDSPYVRELKAYIGIRPEEIGIRRILQELKKVTPPVTKYLQVDLRTGLMSLTVPVRIKAPFLPPFIP